MSTVIGLGFIVVCGGSVAACYRLCRPRQPSEEQRAAQAAARVGLPPVGPDDKPGTNAAALDWIELTYGAASYDGPGWAPGRFRFQPPGLSEAELDATEARLQAAIDEQQEGETP